MHPDFVGMEDMRGRGALSPGLSSGATIIAAPMGLKYKKTASGNAGLNSGAGALTDLNGNNKSVNLSAYSYHIVHSTGCHAKLSC